jgi:hypothetical protein
VVLDPETGAARWWKEMISAAIISATLVTLTPGVVEQLRAEDHRGVSVLFG